LAAELARGGTAGRIVTGEAEAGITARLRDTALPPGWEFLDSPPLAVLAALLESAPVYVGNDSGVTHLAAACGAPVVALFRSEFAVHWRPSGGAIVLASDDVDGILLDAAFRAVAEVAASGSGNPCAMIGRNEGER
jgi:ADP-heptose:LPS heptosyltransferase